MRISEIEKIMQQGHFSEELFAEFQTALKRVPKNLRCQHCAATARCLRYTDPENGIRLIRYGLEIPETRWVDRMVACGELGGIYEASSRYPEAKAAYESMLSAVPEDKRADYIPNLSMNILRAELHCSKFEYTEYAYVLYQSVLKADAFTAAFRQFAFYRAIMELIIAKKNKARDAQADAYNAATLALNNSETTGMDLLLKRHRYNDDAHVSREARAFLKKNKI